MYPARSWWGRLADRAADVVEAVLDRCRQPGAGPERQVGRLHVLGPDVALELLEVRIGAVRGADVAGDLVDQGDDTGDLVLGEEADLQVELVADTETCPAKLRLRAKVLNRGAIGVSEGVEVTFYHGTDIIGVVTTPKDVLPGGSVEVTLDYPVPTTELDTPLDFSAIVDSNMANNECEGGGEDNNSAMTTGQCNATNPK